MYTETREFKILFLLVLTLMIGGLLIVVYALQVRITSGTVQGANTSTQLCKPYEQRICGTCNTCDIPGACKSICSADGSAWECVADSELCSK
jgi:hypothetical protein